MVGVRGRKVRGGCGAEADLDAAIDERAAQRVPGGPSAAQLACALCPSAGASEGPMRGSGAALGLRGDTAGPKRPKLCSGAKRVAALLSSTEGGRARARGRLDP